MSHIPTDVPVKGYIGDQLPQALEGADVVVILAGVPRKPGMTRADLFAVNADVIKGLVEEVGRSCPKALVAIVTNPVNSYQWLRLLLNEWVSMILSASLVSLN